MLSGRQAFANYAQKFMVEGDTRIAQASTGRQFVRRNFVVDDAMLTDFRDQLKKDRVVVDEDGFTRDLDFIKAMIRFEIDNALFGIADARRHLIAVDPQAQLALEQFGEAQKLTDASRGATRAGH
jgi:carboxyl-terminal processing protease